MSANPYAAPQANIEPVDSQQEAIRKEHLNTEASIKAVGSLYFLNCIFLAVAGVMQIVALKPGNLTYALGFLLSFFAMATVLGFGGVGLRGLKGWGRIIGTIGGVIGLIGFPIGTLISGYILYLLWGKKGRVVFSPAYRDVIAATPHIKYKTSIVVWIILGLLVLLVAFAFIAPLLR